MKRSSSKPSARPTRFFTAGFWQIRKILPPVVFFVTLTAAWELAVDLLKMPRIIVPTPREIYFAFVETGSTLLTHALVTLQEILIGFVFGTTIAIIMGIAIVYSATLSRVIWPVAILVKVTPVIAIAPILTIWFGYGIWSKIVITMIISFFPLLVSTSIGLRAVDPRLIDMLASLSATEWQIFSQVKFPGAFPHIFSALRVTITLSVIGAVVGEFVGSKEGLGYLASLALAFINTPILFAVLIVLATIGISLFSLIVAIERLVAPWIVLQKAQT